MRYIFFTIAIALLSACTIILSVNPITPPEAQEHDKQLFGTWYDPENPEDGFMHVGTGIANSMSFILIDFDYGGNVSSLACSGHSSRLDDRTYLNIKCEKQKQENNYYIFLKYHIEHEDILHLFIMDPERTAKAITTGSLKGTVRKGPSPTSEPEGTKPPQILITDESSRIAEYLRKHDDELFLDELETLHRLRLPEMASEPGGKAQFPPEKQ